MEILFGVPQSSILDPLPFIFLTSSYVTYSLLWMMLNLQVTPITPYAVRTNINEVIVALEDTYKQLFQWFKDSHMKANPDKWHLICSTDDHISLSIESEVIKNSNCRKLLGIKIDDRLTFKNHILVRITSYMGFTKKCTLVYVVSYHSLIIVT